MSSGAMAVLTDRTLHVNRPHRTATLRLGRCLKPPCPKSESSIPTVLASALALGALSAAPALASHSQANYFEGSSDLLNPSTRPHAIAQMQALGVKALRVELYWAAVAPGPTSATKPSFDMTNPGNYAWGEFDTLIAEAQRLHWKVLLTVTSPVPRWATSNKKAPYVTKPDPKDFEEFMTAVARHYGPAGSFGSTVSLFSIWNEPNHPAFLQPQWNTNGSAASPRIYRALYQAGLRGAQSRRHRQPEGAARRDGADRLRAGQLQARKSEGPAARRRPAAVHARNAVPEQQVPEIGLVHAADGRRLRPPRLHDGCRPAATNRAKRTTSRSACSRACRAR